MSSTAAVAHCGTDTAAKLRVNADTITLIAEISTSTDTACNSAFYNAAVKVRLLRHKGLI